jgi:hypothetical protein
MSALSIKLEKMPILTSMQTISPGRKTRRSPLKKRPLRQPGQSLDERINYLVHEKIDYYGTVICVSIVLVLMAWHGWYFQYSLSPYMMTIVAAVIAAYSFKKIRIHQRDLKNLRMGRDGERLVGESLERLREIGCVIFHDFICGNFNIDHIIVGPRGIFTIETKTISKPSKGRAEIQYDGENITINGFRPNRDPIARAKYQANWLKDLLWDFTGIDISVRPVVLYPGWFISRQPREARVWVLNEKAFPQFLINEPVSLDPEDVQLIAGHFSRYARQEIFNSHFKN